MLMHYNVKETELGFASFEPFACCFRLCLHLVWTIACVPGLSLYLALLDIVCQSKTHTYRRITLCLACVVPVCHCMNLACFVTPFLNKRLANGSAHFLSRRLCKNNTLEHVISSNIFSTQRQV